MIPFHLAFPVTDLVMTRQFYEQVLGCPVGRSTERWIDFDFFGHQITAHLVDQPVAEVATNAVDRKQVPVQHFGAILDLDSWKKLADQLINVGTEFIIAPYIRFEGQPGEQATMFFLDPNGNALEFKAFGSQAAIFETA